ncbi:hypothetical protein ABE10_12480 [Bacillus toyonensis]|nr:hypothetical protein [Bacillus toyonensis]
MVSGVSPGAGDRAGQNLPVLPGEEALVSREEEASSDRLDVSREQGRVRRDPLAAAIVERRAVRDEVDEVAMVVGALERGGTGDVRRDQRAAALPRVQRAVRSQVEAVAERLDVLRDSRVEVGHRVAVPVHLGALRVDVVDIIGPRLRIAVSSLDARRDGGRDVPGVQVARGLLKEVAAADRLRVAGDRGERRRGPSP